MAIECLPAVTRCFSGKALKITSKRFNLKSADSPRSSSSLTNSSGSGGRSLVGSVSSRSHAITTPRKSREEELMEVFRHFDVDGDGKISADELRAYFGSIGEYLSYEDAEGVVGELDTDGDGMLDFNDFVRMMDMNKQRKTIDGGGLEKEDEDDDDDLKKAFEMFEHERGSGRITPRGLQRMLGRLGDPKSHDECAAMIQMYDIDGDGELDFHEFHRMMS